MKPRNKFEKEVNDLFPKLPSISAFDERKIDTLLDELDALAIDSLNDEYCWNKSYQNTSRPSGTFKDYYTIVTTFHGYQVIRTFLLECRRRYHSQMGTTRYHEVLQRWISPTGEKAVVAKSFRAFSYDYDDWAIGSQLSLKSELKTIPYNGNYRTEYLQEARPDNTHYVRSLSLFKTRGLTRSILHSNKISLVRAMELALDYRGEYFLKNNHRKLFMMIAGNHSKKDQILKYFKQIRIADRHKYDITDMDIWLDMINELVYLDKDICNPFYICPDNITEAHDKWVEKANRKRTAIKAEEDRKRAIANEKKYRETHGKFFGIEFSNEDKSLNFHVIPSISEMVAEGQHMHHCVGVYWSHENSLIISCRDKDYNRVSTIEINLRTLTIAQNRGLQNSKPKDLDRINECIEEHMYLIKDAMSDKLLKKEVTEAA